VSAGTSYEHVGIEYNWMSLGKFGQIPISTNDALKPYCATNTRDWQGKTSVELGYRLGLGLGET